MERPAAEIVAIEYSLPELVETNAALQALYPHWEMDAVYRKTGVLERRIAAPDECASDLAYAACVRLLESTATDPAEIDGLIVCTQSPDYVMPGTSALLQHRLGLSKRVAAFDYTLACSGYVYGLAICKAFIESQLLGSILLVTCDTYSKYIRPDDRATRTLFGDAAAVTLIRRGVAGIREVDMATDGSGAEQFIVRGGGCRDLSRSAVHKEGTTAGKFIDMNGLSVLSFVKKEIPAFTRNLLCKSRLTSQDVDLFIFHQASKISLDQISQMLEVPPEKTFTNVERIGNTVSSSIPIAIKDAALDGKLKPGMVMMLIGFGVGFSWAGAVVRWTDRFRGAP